MKFLTTMANAVRFGPSKRRSARSRAVTVRYTKSGMVRTATLDRDRKVTIRTERETYRTTLDGWGEIAQNWIRYGWRKEP